MLDFAGADAEGQRTESAVRGSVAIAADDGETGLRDAEFRADDVHDALIAAEHVEEAHTVLLAIARQGFELQPRIVIHDRQFAVFRRNRSGHHGEGEVGTADFASGGVYARKGLRGSAFVNELA